MNTSGRCSGSNQAERWYSSVTFATSSPGWVWAPDPCADTRITCWHRLDEPLVTILLGCMDSAINSLQDRRDTHP